MGDYAFRSGVPLPRPNERRQIQKYWDAQEKARELSKKGVDPTPPWTKYDDSATDQQKKRNKSANEGWSRSGKVIPPDAAVQNMNPDSDTKLPLVHADPWRRRSEQDL